MEFSSGDCHLGSEPGWLKHQFARRLFTHADCRIEVRQLPYQILARLPLLIQISSNQAILPATSLVAFDSS
jgi:hypothetical protein